MDVTQFNAMARRFGGRLSRRHVALLVGTLAARWASSGTANAKKKKHKKAKDEKKPVCLDGQTIMVPGSKRKQYLDRGATNGACPAACSPRCDGSRCGISDGCGGTCGCGKDAVCDDGTCRACTVTCTGSSFICGAYLTEALQGGGTVVVCPGRYGGSFSIKTDMLVIGAGAGDDPASNTILDAQGALRTLSITSNTNVGIRNLRVTGARSNEDYGGGLLCGSNSDVTITGCAIVDNQAGTGGGIATVGKVQLQNTLLSGNTSKYDQGGGLYIRNTSFTSTVDGCTITNNSAPKGGGVAAFYGNAQIRDTTIDGNQATTGGGLYVEAATVTLDDGTAITNNRVSGSGGGIYRLSGTVNRNGATINGNRNAAGPDNCVGLSC
jgi:hypothetical protein